MDNDTRALMPRSVERRQTAIITSATSDAVDAHRSHTADCQAVDWDTTVETAVATAADLAARSGYRPHHYGYLTRFFLTMARVSRASRSRAARAAGREQPNDGRDVTVDLGAQLAHGVDDPAATLTATTDGIREAVEAARHLADGGWEPEAWSLLAGYTACLGDRIPSIHRQTGTLADEHAARIPDTCTQRPHDPSTPADMLGDLLSL